jgi:hypothetical protein
VAVLAHPVFAEDLPTTPDAPVHTTISAFANTGLLLSGDLLADDLSHTPEEVRDAWQWLHDHPEEFDADWVSGGAEWTDHARHNTALAVSEGRTVVPASDAGWWFVPHGLGLHHELAELVRAGMTPREALGAATATAASVLGWDDAGYVSAGYRADLLVVSGDPTADVAALRDVVAVFLEGELVVAGDAWVADGDGTFCLDERDCAERCDLVDHTCAEACDPPYDRAGSCDADTWCMPADAVVTTAEGVCHAGDDCDVYAQDCEPAYYGENCAPVDVDTNVCWPSGPRREGQTCSWEDPDFYCEQGLFCSWITYLCYELCDPDAPSCPGCTRQYVEGQPWFGLCP